MFKRLHKYLIILKTILATTYKHVKRIEFIHNLPSIIMLKHNIIYFIWFSWYFFLSYLMIGANLKGFFTCIVIYAVSLGIAFSEIGEQILRFINGIRKLETKREKHYLIPIFEEVYEDVKQVSTKVNKKIEICIMDTMNVNACAVGRRTIAVTQGAMEIFSEDELKGVITHEFAHIIHGDTKATLFNIVGNGFFSAIVLAFRFLIKVLKTTLTPVENKTRGILEVIIELFRWYIELQIFLMLFWGNVILSVNSRKSEFKADKFAFEVGYGEYLTDALYLLQKMSLGEKMNLVQHMQASHPHIAKRIGRLEFLEDNLNT